MRYLYLCFLFILFACGPKHGKKISSEQTTPSPIVFPLSESDSLQILSWVGEIVFTKKNHSKQNHRQQALQHLRLYSLAKFHIVGDIFFSELLSGRKYDYYRLYLSCHSVINCKGDVIFNIEWPSQFFDDFGYLTVDIHHIGYIERRSLEFQIRKGKLLLPLSFDIANIPN